MKKLGFGLMRLPTVDGDASRIDIDALKKMVDVFIERGFTYFDTAYVYHNMLSEAAFREAVVKRYPRDSFTIADKLPTWLVRSKADRERMFAEQLDRCGVGYFDYYLIHNLGVENYAIAEKYELFPFVSAMKAAGKCRNIGFSFHDTAATLDRILSEHPEVDFVQLQINYLDWDSADVQSRLCYETAVRHGKPVIVMEPVKGGTLAKLPPAAQAVLEANDSAASPASWAIRYAAGLENVATVLSGMSDLGQVEDNTGYMRDFKPLSAGERAALGQVVNLLNASAAVPCTGCNYCTAGCPMNIPIPDCFSLFNAELREAGGGAGYARLASERAKASDCIGCGQCEQACPQHIGIVGRLKDVAAAFEKQ